MLSRQMRRPLIFKLFHHICIIYIHFTFLFFSSSENQGRKWAILRGGRRYIYNRKDEIIHDLNPSVKCVASQFRYCKTEKTLQ